MITLDINHIIAILFGLISVMSFFYFIGLEAGKKEASK